MKLSFNDERKKILNLAIPAIAGLSAQLIVSLVDTAMVGRLDDAEYSLAAMGIGVLATWAIVSFFSSMATGTHVLISRSFGNKKNRECGEILNSALILAAFTGLAVVLVFILFADDIAQFFSADIRVGELAGDYLFYRFLGIPFFLISVSFRGFFFGIGKTKIFMYSGVLTNILNIIFNYFFIYGGFGFEGMGLAGAGLGSSIATVFDGLFYIVIASTHQYKNKFGLFRNIKYDSKIVKQILKISLPVSFQNIFILVGFLSFIAITGLLGTLEQAASQTVISALFISFMPSFGFGIAAQTLVGNALGEGKNSLAKVYGNETAKLATYYALIVAFFFLFMPSYVILLFTTQQNIIETAAPLLRIAGAAQIVYASGVVIAYSLQSAGKSFFVMSLDILINWIVFVPLAYLFAIPLNGGILGAWLAMPFYVILYTSAMLLKFNFGSWIRDKY